MSDMQYEEMDLIELNIDDVGDNINQRKNVTKKDILKFFKKLNSIPSINIGDVYASIMNNKVNLPKYNFEKHYLLFGRYITDENQEVIIIHNAGTDEYVYISKNKVYVCNIGETQQIFYFEIAKRLNQSVEETHDALIGKLGDYQAILFYKEKGFLSSLDEFIEDNIEMFNNALEKV